MKEMDKHCMICNKVYYEKEEVWVELMDYLECNLGKPTSGIYHKDCMETYFNRYVPFIPEEDKQKIRSELEQKIREK